MGEKGPESTLEKLILVLFSGLPNFLSTVRPNGITDREKLFSN